MSYLGTTGGWRYSKVAPSSLLGTEQKLALGSRMQGGVRPTQPGGLLELLSSIFIPKKELGPNQSSNPPSRGAHVLGATELQEQG